MRFDLYIQNNNKKVKTTGEGTLCIDKSGAAMFFENDAGADSKLLAELKRARIDFANSKGIMLSGMEPCGCDLYGVMKFKYKEWWLLFKGIE